MTRYHIAADGNPKVCDAEIKCPLGSESPHFDGSIGDARKWASTVMEESNDHNVFSNTVKSVEQPKMVKIAGFDVPEKHQDEFLIVVKEVNAQLGGTYGEVFAQETLSMVHRFMSETDSIVCARTRVVFFENEHVIKVPINDEGVSACREEYDYSQRYIDDPERYIPIAKTEEILDGNVYYNRMEKVEPITDLKYSELPDWAGFIDGAQVGYTKDGTIVAYDL